MVSVLYLVLFATGAICVVNVNAQKPIPPYVKQCRNGDPNLVQCITDAIHHLRPWLTKGIPEIELPAIEPFRMDELSLALTTGPNGYKITLRDMDIFGASNFSIMKIKLGKFGVEPFEAKLRIPKMDIEAKYTSSGVLIIVPASGNGTFNAKLGDIMATVKGVMTENTKKGEKYLHLKSLDIDLNIKDVRMSVKKVFKNNRILVEATNLFLRENGQEVLKAMMPQLKVKLAVVFMKVANQLLSNVPTNLFLIDQ